MLRLLHSPAGYGLLALLIFFLILVAAECAVFAPWPAYGAPAGCSVCLSQIYGHGGKSGSYYDADFVEFFNRSDEPIALAGWRLDYADVHSEDWRTIDLSPLALPPYGYALVGLKRGATGAPLPAVDLAGNLNLGGSDGKLQLVDGENTLIDLVGYGGAEWAEGAPAPGAAAGTGLLRLDGGCRDSDDNAADFVQVQPIPHNSQSPAYPCVTAEQPPPPTATDTPLPTETPTSLPTPTATETSTPVPTDTLLPVYTTQPAITAESTVAWTPEPTLGPTAPASPAETPTATPLPTPTWGPTATPTATLAAAQTAYATPDFLPSATSDPPLTAPQTPVGSDELTAQATASETPTPSPAATETPPATLTATVTSPHTPTPAATATKTPRSGTSTATWTPTWTPAPANWLTPTTTPAPTRHATQTPNMTATPAQANAFTATAVAKMTGTPAPTLPAMWSRAGAPSPLQIDEVAYAGSDGEYIVLANVLDTDLPLAGWLLGDAERPGDGEGMYALPDLRLAPGDLYVVARQADVFHARYDRWPDATLEDSANALPQLARRRDLAGGKLALNDSGDEIVLLAPNLLLADAMAFGTAEYGVLGLAGELRAAGDYTLQRVPGATFPAVADVRHRFLAAPPRPFEPRGLPLGAAPHVAAVGRGYLGVWGTLGAHSNFTRGYTAPPHYLIAAAAAQGLQFVAVADTGALAPPVWIPRGMTVLPAWGWHGGNAESAVVYNDQPEPGLSSHGLSGYRDNSSGLVQWQGKDNPALDNLAALAADEGRSQDIAWFFKRWRMLGGPLLPAGNAEPNLPGAIAVEPHYTGLAVREQDVAGLLDALAAGRGWVTTDPNSWLALQAETAEGDLYWMGSWLPSAGQATVGQVMLHVAYGDLEGEMASLAIWQDGALLEELVLPASDGLWSVPVSLAPGTLLAAVATQADGDYAVTAPLQVLRSSGENGGGTSNAATPESKLPVNSTSPGAVQSGNEHHDDGDHDGAAAMATLEPTYGQAGGAPGTVAQAKVAGLEAEVELRAVVTAPPGLFNGSIYVADLAGDGVTAGIGANVYLRQGVFPPLKEGDRVWLHGRWSSYRGEMELVLEGPQDVWKLESGPALHPLPVWGHTVCESVEGRLVTFIGTVVGWQGDSLLLVDPAHPAATPTRVTVRSSLPWKRPFVYKGEIWRVTGIVSQFARKSPWNDGYRVLPRYVEDLVRME